MLVVEMKKTNRGKTVIVPGLELYNLGENHIQKFQAKTVFLNVFFRSSYFFPPITSDLAISKKCYAKISTT